MMLSGDAKLAGVIGWPVAHSLSPRLHGHWLEALDIDGAYLPLAVAPEHLESAVRGLAHAGFEGANVTIPHKQAVQCLCDNLSENARAIGAVNTLVFRDGEIAGSNTDGFGFLENLRQGAPTWDAGAGPAVVLGAGGAARAVVWALLDAGVPEVRLLNRTEAKAAALAETFSNSSSAPVAVAAWDRRHAVLDDAALLVNSTSLGMTGQPALPIDLSSLPPTAIVTDLVYNPLETPLLAAARKRGNKIVDGLGMLLHQARPGFTAWFGVQPDVTVALRRAVLDVSEHKTGER